MSRTPMPSPKGTNHERAYLPSGSRVVAAYDAAPGAEDDYSILLGFLKDKLESADFAHVQRLLGVDQAESPDDSEVSGASDAARRRYHDDARGLHRAGVIGDAELERRLLSGPRREPTAAETRAFAERFPHAGRLKI